MLQQRRPPPALRCLAEALLLVQPLPLLKKKIRLRGGLQGKTLKKKHSASGDNAQKAKCMRFVELRCKACRAIGTSK
jgi:hypothetical protein